MADDLYSFERVGGVTSPVAAADVTDGQLSSAFDPAQDRMIAFFRAVIVAELTPAWTVARGGTTLEAAAPVADTLWCQPTRGALRGQKISFPLLALARTGATHEELTLVREQLTTTWSLDYVLGPLSPPDYRKLGAALIGALRCISTAIRNRWHPAYDGGVVQWGRDEGGLDRVRILRHALGPASFGEDGDGVEYYGLHVDLETTELDGFPDDYAAPYMGWTFHGAVGGANGVIPNVVIGASDVPYRQD